MASYESAAGPPLAASAATEPHSTPGDVLGVADSARSSAPSVPPSTEETPSSSVPVAAPSEPALETPAIEVSRATTLSVGSASFAAPPERSGRGNQELRRRNVPRHQRTVSDEVANVAAGNSGRVNRGPGRAYDGGRDLGTPLVHQDTHDFAHADRDDIDPVRSRVERRVRFVMIIKRFFLAFHISYIVLLAVLCSFIIYALEHDSDYPEGRTTYIDALFMAVSGVTCTGLTSVDTKAFRQGSVVSWHIIVFLGSTVFTSIAPSILRVWTLKLFRQLEGDTMSPLRAKHITRLLKTSRIMIGVTLVYAAVFFFIGMVMLASSLGLFEGLLRTVSAFGNAGFITNPPPEFATEATNLITTALIVAAGSTLFPVFLRPFTQLCAWGFEAYIRVSTKLAPNRRITGDPKDWNVMMFEAAAEVSKQRHDDHDEDVASTSSSGSHTRPTTARHTENSAGSGSSMEDQPGRRGGGGPVDTAELPGHHTTVNAEREPLLGHGGRTGSHYGLDDTSADGRSGEPETDEMYTGLQNLSMLQDDEVRAKATHRRVWTNLNMRGFRFILSSTKPVNHHPWLFVASDTTYLFVAWMLVVIFQFVPYSFEQWNDGVLKPWTNQAMKALVVFTQVVCNRFSGISFFDLNSLSPGQICTVIFALYLPALPIPTERTRRKWKEMFSGGFFRLFRSRFWWLFTATFLIIFIEENHAFKYMKYYGDHQQRVNPPTAKPGLHPGPTEMLILAWHHGVLTRVLFEVLSAYATAGVSLQLPSSTGSLSSSFTPWSKIIVMLVMIAGRHRNMDLGLDIGLTDIAATEKRDPERARRTVNDFDLGSLQVPPPADRSTLLDPSAGAAGTGWHLRFPFGSTGRTSPAMKRRYSAPPSPFRRGTLSVDADVPRSDTGSTPPPPVVVESVGSSLPAYSPTDSIGRSFMGAEQPASSNAAPRGAVVPPGAVAPVPVVVTTREGSRENAQADDATPRVANATSVPIPEYTPPAGTTWV